MRILWLSPWMRPLNRVYVEGLIGLGAEVLLVTADLHPESDAARPYELVLRGRPHPTKDWINCAKGYAAARQFKPDIVLTELLRDPRWKPYARLAPRVQLVHDDQPHDHTHIPPWWNTFFFERWNSRSDATVAFSDYVAESVQRNGVAAGMPVYSVPLLSDLDDRLVPPFVPAAERRNFLLIGRQKPYKNYDVVFSAWAAHVSESAWQGDELVLLGDGDIGRPLPPHARWERGDYNYAKVVDELAHAKGSLVHYRQASQSGVQVLSMQLGVPTLVSASGALPEMQYPKGSITDMDDVAGLTSAIDALADVREVEKQAAASLAHYRACFTPAVASARMLDVCGAILEQTAGSAVSGSAG